MAEAKTVKARFVGDPSDPNAQVPDLLDAYGTTFEAGKFAEVSEEHADKVRNNNHFEVQGDKKAAQREETGESTAELASRVNQITDRDGLEQMLKTEKRPAAKNVLEARLNQLSPGEQQARDER